MIIPMEKKQYGETLCLKLLNYKLNYISSYFLLLLIYTYNPKEVIDYSMDILNKIMSGDINKYIFSLFILKKLMLIIVFIIK